MHPKGVKDMTVKDLNRRQLDLLNKFCEQSRKDINAAKGGNANGASPTKLNEKELSILESM